MRIFRVLLSMVWLAIGTIAAQAQGQGNCIGPGDIMDVPTPGFLRNDTPNLFHRFGGDLYPANLLSHTTSRLRILMPLSGLPASTIFKVVHVETNGQEKVVANPKTCASWDSGGGGGGGGSGGGVGSDGTRSGQILNQRGLAPMVPATRNEVAAPSGGPEYIVLGAAEPVTAAQVLLLTEGAAILRSTSLSSLSVRMSIVDLNGMMSLNEFRALLAQHNIAVTVDKHTVYGASAGADDFVGELVGISSPETCPLARTVRIGLIDGPLDSTNPALAGAPIFESSVLSERERLGSTDHATGIASLILGASGGRVPTGLASGAQLFSAVAFARSGGRDVARLENIAKGLDWMISRDVEIVNMSLSGPMNTTFAQIVEMASAKGLIMVAATGNGRATTVSYPASDPRVFAITAIDAAKRHYRRANSGPSVDFAAPGVDLLVASKRGSAVRSGTSYASAVATALIAHEIAVGRSTHAALFDILRRQAEDLGDGGHDHQFGWGLIKSDACG